MIKQRPRPSVRPAARPPASPSRWRIPLNEFPETEIYILFTRRRCRRRRRPEGRTFSYSRGGMAFVVSALFSGRLHKADCQSAMILSALCEVIQTLRRSPCCRAARPPCFGRSVARSVGRQPSFPPFCLSPLSLSLALSTDRSFFELKT